MKTAAARRTASLRKTPLAQIVKADCAFGYNRYSLLGLVAPELLADRPPRSVVVGQLVGALELV